MPIIVKRITPNQRSIRKRSSSPLENIPPELFIQITSYLRNLSDLLALSWTSKSLKTQCKSFAFIDLDAVMAKFMIKTRKEHNSVQFMRHRRILLNRLAIRADIIWDMSMLQDLIDTRNELRVKSLTIAKMGGMDALGDESSDDTDFELDEESSDDAAERMPSRKKVAVQPHHALLRQFKNVVALMFFVWPENLLPPGVHFKHLTRFSTVNPCFDTHDFSDFLSQHAPQLTYLDCHAFELDYHVRNLDGNWLHSANKLTKLSLTGLRRDHNLSTLVPSQIQCLRMCYSTPNRAFTLTQFTSLQALNLIVEDGRFNQELPLPITLPDSLQALRLYDNVFINTLPDSVTYLELHFHDDMFVVIPWHTLAPMHHVRVLSISVTALDEFQNIGTSIEAFFDLFPNVSNLELHVNFHLSHFIRFLPPALEVLCLKEIPFYEEQNQFSTHSLPKLRSLFISWDTVRVRLILEFLLVAPALESIYVSPDTRNLLDDPSDDSIRDPFVYLLLMMRNNYETLPRALMEEFKLLTTHILMHHFEECAEGLVLAPYLEEVTKRTGLTFSARCERIVKLLDTLAVEECEAVTHHAPFVPTEGSILDAFWDEVAPNILPQGVMSFIREGGDHYVKSQVQFRHASLLKE